MSDSTNVELLVRNAELTVELRMVKEQLAQAHQSTQYLLQLIGRSQPSNGTGHVDDIRPQLQLEPGKRAGRRDSVIDTLSTAAEVDATSQCTANAQLVNFDSEMPLLDDNADETLPDTPSLLPVSDSKAREPARDSIGLGISNDDTTPSTSFSRLSIRTHAGFSIRNPDGTSSFVPTPTLGMTPDSSFSGIRASNPIPFTGNEHRSLAGKACFWMDMSGEELTEVFARYARGDARHSAEEYRAYFEDVLRPEYEEKVKRLQATRGALLAPFGDQQAEDQPRGRALSTQHVGTEEVGKTDSCGPPPVGEQASEEDQPSEQVVPASVVEAVPSNALKTASRKSSASAGQDFTDIKASETSQEPEVSALDSYQISLLNLEAVTQCSEVEVAVPVETGSANEVPSDPTESSIGGYIPPRLHNPSALEDAKSLRAEFQDSGPSRGRRPRERSYPELSSSRHAMPEEASRPAKSSYGQPYQNLSYTTYPMAVEELFAEPPECGRSPYRTVLISGIPAGTMLIEVLDSMKGGRIYSAIMLDTAGMRTTPPVSTDSALVTFIFSRQARFVVEHWKDCNAGTTAQLLPTVSRPLPARVMPDIHQHNLSRVLFVFDTQQIWTPKIVADQLMRNGAQYPLKFEFYSEVPGLMLFHYASMAEAKVAWLAVSRDRPFFGDVSRGFFADPCDIPVEKAEAQDEIVQKADAREVRVGKEAGEVQEGVIDLSTIENRTAKYRNGINSGTESRMFEG